MSFQGTRSVCEVAQSLGIPTMYLYRWRGLSQQQGTAAFRGHGKLAPQEEEIRRLKRELAEVKEDREILKKALSIFSGTQKS